MKAIVEIFSVYLSHFLLYGASSWQFPDSDIYDFEI